MNSERTCDYVINGTTILYSHDDIRNLGHTVNDIMNVWLMMWLTGTSRQANSMSLLNIDAFNLGHNFNDDPKTCAFYKTYEKTFQNILQGSAFGKKTVCLQRVITQMQPAKWFVWDSWFKDNQCSFVGPSTLFQRWNLAVRHNYGTLLANDMLITNKERISVVFVQRHATTNRWGSERTSRNVKNSEELLKEIKKSLKLAYPPSVEIIVEAVAFEKLSFEQQVKLASETSIIIGTHGAGLTLGLHMSLGSKYCCGVLEIFPQGEYFGIRGHGL